MTATHLAEWAEIRADELGIEIETEPDDANNEMFLAWIRNASGERGRAGIFLRELVAESDRTGVDLGLRVQNGAPGLIEFYGRFGFILDEAPGIVAEPKMVRLSENAFSDAPVLRFSAFSR